MHKAASAIGGANEVFALIDANHDGKLELSELRHTIRQHFGIRKTVLSEAAIKALFAFLDKDGGGRSHPDGLKLCWALVQ